MWIGLCLALMLIGSILVSGWNRLIKRLLLASTAAEPAEAMPSKISK
jgi:hypothetical protein